MQKIIIKASAKINIGLNIISKRDDGFHNIETIFYPINDLNDELTVEESDEFSFKSDHDFENIIVKAVELLKKRVNKKINSKITLNKIIPIGAGLGGGSSNAAAVIVALNKIYGINLSKKQMEEIALELGSDVPFFLNSEPAIGRSRGENLSSLDLRIDHPILLVNPGIHISTKEAFSRIIPSQPVFDYNDILNIPIDQYQKFIVNDFEKIVFQKYPVIRDIKETLYSADALFASMSGTGSTVYGIFQNISDAVNISNKFPKEYFIFISNIKNKL